MVRALPLLTVPGHACRVPNALHAAPVSSPPTERQGRTGRPMGRTEGAPYDMRAGWTVTSPGQTLRAVQGSTRFPAVSGESDKRMGGDGLLPTPRGDGDAVPPRPSREERAPCCIRPWGSMSSTVAAVVQPWSGGPAAPMPEHRRSTRPASKRRNRPRSSGANAQFRNGRRSCGPRPFNRLAGKCHVSV